MIREKIRSSNELEKASTINPIKVPNWEIKSNGLLPKLSLSFPNIGPNINPNIALTDNTNPIIKVDVL